MIHWNSTAMISADAKYKIRLGKPDFLIAAVSREHVVIVGKNEKFKVSLREKCPNMEFFLVCIFLYSDPIRTRKNSVFGHFSCSICDHDFSKVLVTSDIILVHSVPKKNHKDDGKNVECNKHAAGKWCSGKVSYSLKDIRTESSSEIRGTTKLSIKMEDFYGPEKIPPCLYLYIDGSGDRKKHRLQSSEKSDISFSAS